MKSGKSRKPPTARTVARLEKHVNELDRIGQGNCSSREFILWRRQTEATLKALYGEESTEVQDFNAIYYAPVFLTCRMGDEAFEEAYRNGLEEARRLLHACMKTIRQRDEPRACERIPRG
jgi:hypothetical protein